MTEKYEVLEFFQWGKQTFEKGQRLIFKKMDDDTAIVSVYGNEAKTLLVNPETILNQIEWRRLRKL